MKEVVKRVTSWVPVMKPLPIVNTFPPDCDALRDWASYGAAVRQRTVRQETTMAQLGTLPDYMYQRQCEISENPASIAFEEEINMGEAATENELQLDKDEADKFDIFYNTTALS